MLAKLRLSRRTYINSVYTLLTKELAEIVQDAQLKKPSNQVNPVLAQTKPDESPQKSVNTQAMHPRINLPDWVISRLLLDNSDISQAIVDLVIWADRIKCWLYQADAELENTIEELEAQATTHGDNRKTRNPQHPDSAQLTKSKKRSNKLADIISSTDEEEKEG